MSCRRGMAIRTEGGGGGGVNDRELMGRAE